MENLPHLSTGLLMMPDITCGQNVSTLSIKQYHSMGYKLNKANLEYK